MFKTFIFYFMLFVLGFFSYNVLKFLIFYFRKSFGKNIFKSLYNYRFSKLVEFLKLVFCDLFRGKDKFRLYGLWAFTGYYGQGKTLGCVLFARFLQKKHTNRSIQIYSNIDIVGQVKKITSWEDLLDLPPNSIFIYDESQSDFSCNIGVRDFPEDFLRRITQCRKRQFAMFLTSPKFNRMNINLRESVHFVVECKNLFDVDRWFFYNFYHVDAYERFIDNKIKLRLSRYLGYNFVVNNADYSLYNTTEEVVSIKKNDKRK